MKRLIACSGQMPAPLLLAGKPASKDTKLTFGFFSVFSFLFYSVREA
ncbi:hypothetical protein HZS38_02225 [Xenorhabdus nematophila]|nr:hypothetical protein [Xenorhabdus nematophila]MBA0018063.1 hypothetical protein [Xenorhabdus nematophila]MCB4427135.1 hypothetical protein [Xenorhabdus nematophila]QNJ37146.1 hypothetical protein H8F46_02520 [Xenorhabdus nematophila]